MGRFWLRRTPEPCSRYCSWSRSFSWCCGPPAIRCSRSSRRRARSRQAPTALPVQVGERGRRRGRLPNRIQQRRPPGQLVPDRGRHPAQPSVPQPRRPRSRRLPAQAPQALRRSRMDRGQDGRGAVRERRHADGRPFRGTERGRGLDAGHERARRRDLDLGPKRILSCRGRWAEVESHDGKRRWWRLLRSNQVTNCS